MSRISHHRTIPDFDSLPRPVYARPEQWDDQGSQTSWHQHPWGQFSYAASGILTVLTPDARYVAPPQYAIWVPAGVEHQVVSKTATQMQSLYIEASALTQSRWRDAQVLDVSLLVRELIKQFCQQEPLWQESSSEKRLAQVLLDQIAQLPCARTQLPLPSDRRLQALCQILQNQPDSCATMVQLATQVGISSRNVSRLFVQQTGMNFRQWRQRLRLLYALDYLEQNQRVTDVALACGYDSLSAFVAAFREQFGVTPGQYT
ncbi:AraC family transcriptional regulator [Celerinatantimonas yamalensis]|uniref:Helix-turn-helix transcriptional regulator n=1 Tax=Celerinatantimonas yamalensis TaxID=559956 RepID=A0ABW9G6J0_9GAMM